MTILNNHPVVELWNGSGIVRVVGKASVMQLVYVTSTDHSDTADMVHNAYDDRKDTTAPPDDDRQLNAAHSSACIRGDDIIVAGAGTADGFRAGEVVSGSNNSVNTPRATDAEVGVFPMLAGNDARRKIKIYSFDEAIRRRILTRVKKPDPWPAEIYRNFSQKVSKVLIRAFVTSGRGSRNRPTRIIEDYTAISADNVLNDHPAPNISLNVSQRESDPWPRATVSVGLYVQLAVLIYASIFGVKDGKLLSSVLFAGGTVALTLGMFLCARIIDNNTIRTR